MIVETNEQTKLKQANTDLNLYPVLCKLIKNFPSSLTYVL